MDDLEKNLCCQSGERMLKAKCTVSVPGSVISAVNTGLLAMQHARNQQNKHTEYQYLRQTSYFIYPGLKTDDIHACKGTLALHRVNCHVTSSQTVPLV
jgi:hypothetical protein